MRSGLADIIDNLPAVEKKIHHMSDVLLANLVMVSEIPAPTFGEENRMRFLVNRFTESDLINCSTDEAGNALGILPGRKGERNILLAAHMDTLFDHRIDHTVYIQDNRVTGPGIGDNSLGVAALATLPACLDYLNIHLDSNLILMGSSKSLGEGNVEGANFFLNHAEVPINFGICIEGMKLGRLSYSSIGMMMCVITLEVPEEYDWTRFGAVGSIVTLHEVMDRILKIPLPRKPKSSIILGSVEGGKGFNKIATKAILRFEVRSESDDIVKDIEQKIQDIVDEVAARSGMRIQMHMVSRRKPGGIKISHPLARAGRAIISKLGMQPLVYATTSPLSAFFQHEVPAVAMGITTGERRMERDESTEAVKIDPMFTGLAQLAAMLLAMDTQTDSRR